MSEKTEEERRHREEKAESGVFSDDNSHDGEEDERKRNLDS
jgi:hypothetical protein